MSAQTPDTAQGAIDVSRLAHETLPEASETVKAFKQAMEAKTPIDAIDSIETHNVEKTEIAPLALLEADYLNKHDGFFESSVPVDPNHFEYKQTVPAWTQPNKRGHSISELRKELYTGWHRLHVDRNGISANGVYLTEPTRARIVHVPASVNSDPENLPFITKQILIDYKWGDAPSYSGHFRPYFVVRPHETFPSIKVYLDEYHPHMTYIQLVKPTVKIKAKDKVKAKVKPTVKSKVKTKVKTKPTVKAKGKIKDKAKKAKAKAKAKPTTRMGKVTLRKHPVK